MPKKLKLFKTVVKKWDEILGARFMLLPWCLDCVTSVGSSGCSSFVAFLLRALNCVPFLTLISWKQGISIFLGREGGRYSTWVNSC